MIRWAALVVTDRRWAAPMASMALGFGLFIGVAIGPPGASFATGTPQIIRVPAPEEDEPAPERRPPDDSGGSSGDNPDPGDGFDEPLTTPPILTSPVVPSTTPAAPVAKDDDEGTAPGTDTEEASDEQTLAGTVIHSNPAADSYAIAATGGAVYALHARELPNPGTRVKMPVRQLANGTYAEDGELETSGRRGSAEIAGTVTFVDPTPEAPAYTVSSPGVSVLVHARATADGSEATLPAVGAFVTVTGAIEKPPSERHHRRRADDPNNPSPTNPPTTSTVETPPPTTTTTTTTTDQGTTAPSCAPDPADPAPKEIEPIAIIAETKLETDGEPGTYGDFAGIVGAVCADSGEVLISADDIRESGQDLLFSVPDAIDISELEVGDSVAATANIAEDGTLELAGLSSDEGSKGADDEELVQGDLER